MCEGNVIQKYMPEIKRDKGNILHPVMLYLCPQPQGKTICGPNSK